MQTENHYTETDLGNVSPNPKGNYDNAAKYEFLDLVTMQGGSYLCVIPVGQTITGTAPEPGATTEYWQCLAMPGDRTPEYIEAHDKVVRLAKEVAQNTTKVAEDKQSVAQMETDVRQLKEQTAESARQAEKSKDSAVGSARAAKTAEDNIRQAESNVRTLINGFDTHVAEKTTEATQAVATAKDNAVQAVGRQETASVQAVKDQTTTYITEQKNLAKQELDKKVEQFGIDVNAIKAEVSEEGQKQITNVQEATTAELAKIAEKGTEQTELVAAEGNKQVQVVQTAAQEIITDREQINTNKEGITQLKEDLAEINLETAINVSEKLDLYPNAAGILRPAVSNFDTYTAIEIPEDVKIKYTKVVVNQYVGKFSFSNKKEIKVGETLKTVLVPGKENKIVNGYIDIPEGYKYLFIATNTNSRGQVIEGDNYFFVKDNKKILKKIAKNTADIEENRKEIEGIKNRPKNKMLYLPEQYNLVVGDTFELFWKGVILANNYKNYNIKVSCEVGNAYAKKYMFTPRMKDVGTKTLKIELYNDAEKLIDTGTVKLIIKAQAKNPAAVKNVLCVGDSLLVNGVWAAESNRRIAKAGGKPAGDNLTNIKYIGTMQKDGIGYEANGGWAFSQYNAESKNPSFVWITTTHNKTGDDQHSVYKDANETEWKIETLEAGKLKMIRVKGSTNMAASGTLTWVQGGTNHESIAFSASEIAAGNPFWNEKTGKVDFAEYVKKVKADSIDYCYILLGWNSSTWDKERTVSEAKKFINNLLLAFPKCQIVLLGLEIPSLDGFGENYGCGWNWHEKSKYVHELDKWYAELAKNNENVTTINISGQFDTENNMQTNIRAVNARNEKTETYQTNGVHPDTSGYLQIADAVYRDLTHKLQM